jgi:hypothetical protein
MDSAPDIATTLQAWLGQLGVGPSAVSPGPTFAIAVAPPVPGATIAALAALAAEAMAHGRTLWIATADDAWLPEISNALDLRLRPLCLVLPGANHAGCIALRATLSLLKSRLARNTEDSEGPAWAALRTRLETDDGLWRSCIAWNARGLDGEPPPDGFASLFPVRIGPWSLGEQLMKDADWVILTHAAQLPAALRTAWPGARRTLLLVADRHADPGMPATVDATARLRAEIEVLGQELAEMELELATAQGELAGFSLRYHELIAGRLAELDRCQAALAQMHLRQAPADDGLHAAARQAAERAAQSRREQAEFRARQEGEPAPFRPGNDLKRRFRQLAQKIHPDRAGSDADRAWRTRLMSEANRAYRAGDAVALEEVLALWLEGRRDDPGAVPPGPTFAGTPAAEALAAEAARMRARIAAIAAELDRLYGSKLYELFTAARLAERQGRDLLAEMVERLDAQIAGIRAELTAAGQPA